MKEDITLELYAAKFLAEMNGIIARKRDAGIVPDVATVREMMNRMSWTREQVLSAALYLEERDRLRIGRTINDSYLTDKIETIWE